MGSGGTRPFSLPAETIVFLPAERVGGFAISLYFQRVRHATDFVLAGHAAPFCAPAALSFPAKVLVLLTTKPTVRLLDELLCRTRPKRVSEYQAASKDGSLKRF